MRQNLFIWTVFMPEIASDPRNYFKFQSCQRCFHKPCDRLRFGGVFPDKFFIINNNYLGIGFFDCPFIAESFDEIERLINSVSFSEFLFNFNEVLGTLTPSERLHFRQENYVSDYSDVAGRIQFIKALWENRVISVIRIPGTFSLDAKMRKWLFANEGLSYMLKKPELEKDSDGPAVTDSLVGADEAVGPQDASGDQQGQDKDQDEDKESTTDGTFSVRLNIDPNDPDSQDDTFTLFSTDDAKTFSKDQTVKDDQIPGDNYTDLTFSDMDTSLSYSLKIDLGKDGNSYFLFENTPYEELHG
jgi:hypothetical protein